MKDPKNPNPFLAKRDRAQMQFNNEINLLAYLFTIHDNLQVGPGRAGKQLEDFIENKKMIAKVALNDYGDKKQGDKQMIHTKATLTKKLHSILSPEDRKKFRPLFTFLWEYWEKED